MMLLIHRTKDMDRLVVQRLIQPTFLSNPVVNKK